MRFIKPLLDRIVPKKHQETNYNIQQETTNQEKYVFHYFISFLVPLVGYILGAILLSKDDSSKRIVAGKTCLVLSVISTVLITVITVSIVNH